MVAPVAIAGYVAYAIWTDWARRWHWAMKVPACVVAFGVWMGLARFILTMTMVAVAAMFRMENGFVTLSPTGKKVGYYLGVALGWLILTNLVCGNPLAKVFPVLRDDPSATARRRSLPW
jgi:hypothetical protein